MKKLYILCGLPGSGKSTWTKKFLESNASFKVMSTDNIIEEMCAKEGITYSEGFQKFIGTATSKFDQDLKTCFNASEDIIIDRTNMSRKARKKFLEMANEKGYESFAVYFNVDEVTLNARLDARAKATGKVIPQFVLENMARTFDMPTREEGFAKVQTIRS